jgi:hypothetical protein
MLRNVNKNAALQRKGMEIATFLPIAAGKSSQRLLNSHWALLKGYRKAAGKCPKAIGQPLGNS